MTGAAVRAFGRVAGAGLAAFLSAASATAAVIGAGDPVVREASAPHVWVHAADGAGTSLCGAWIRLRFIGTRRVALVVDTAHMKLPSAARYPILAWTVDGGPEHTHRLAAGETSVTLVADAADA